MWLDGDETLVNTVDRDGNVLPINMVQGHSLTHDPLVVLVSFPFRASWTMWSVLLFYYIKFPKRTIFLLC